MRYLSRLIIASFLISLISLPSSAATRDWSLTDIAGGKFKLSENTGDGPVLLIFWATWCKPCKKELTEFKDSFKALEENGTRIIMISEDSQKTKSRVKPFVKSKGYPWTCLLDPDGKVLKSYGGKSIPYLVLLNNGGSPTYKHRGAMKNLDELNHKIDAIQSAGSSKESGKSK